MSLALQPISFPEAKAFIRAWHRHHLPPQGWRFGIAINDGSEVVGVVTVGRPVARALDNGVTLEITRCCVKPGQPNGCSMLYGAAVRASRALGYQRVITYCLKAEPGTSLVAVGFRVVYETADRSWNMPGRPRVETAPLGQKRLWEVAS